MGSPKSTPLPVFIPSSLEPNKIVPFFSSRKKWGNRGPWGRFFFSKRLALDWVFRFFHKRPLFGLLPPVVFPPKGILLSPSFSLHGSPTIPQIPD